jgi:Resolvase, N terminal domain
MPPRRIAVCLEATPKQAFASALDWPGWCRTGRDADAALKTLASYAERDAAVAEHTEVSFPSTITFDVIERVPGGPATAFGAPECRRPFPQVTVARMPRDARVFLDGGLRMVSGLVVRVSGKVDVPGRMEALVGRTIAYCRVSSRDQNPQLQLDALRAHGYDQLFAEKQSARQGTARPEFTRALAALRADDTLVF